MRQKYKCLDCETKHIKENEIVLTINSDGEEVLHCPHCYSTQLIYEEWYLTNPINIINPLKKLTDEI